MRVCRSVGVREQRVNHSLEVVRKKSERKLSTLLAVDGRYTEYDT